MPCPIMDELPRKLRDCDFITKIGMKARFNLMRMAKGHEKFTAFRTKVRQYEYMVVHFGLTNTPAMNHREINDILRLLLRMN
jgi:hypothetical protein